MYPESKKSELCSEAVFLEGQSHSQGPGMEAGEEKETSLHSLPSRSFSSQGSSCWLNPSAPSSQPGSMGDTGIGGQFLGHRQGRRGGRTGWGGRWGQSRRNNTVLPQQCTENSVYLLFPTFVTFRDYFALFNNVTIDISVGVHLCLSGNWKQHFLGRGPPGHLGLLLPCKTKPESLGLYVPQAST